MQLALGLLLFDSAVARVHGYFDDDGLTVWSPQATARAHVAGDVSAEAGWTADVITAATVDVRTAASPRAGFQETRHELHAGPRWEFRPGASAQATYTYSTEPDYTAHVLSAGLSQELLHRRLTLGGVYRFLTDTVGRVGEPGFEESLRGHGGDLSASAVLDRRTVLGATYSLQRLDGFQASPYRFVPIHDEAGEVRASLPELTPDGRSRHAVSLHARRALGWRAYAVGLVRFYRDSWEVQSHTGEAEVSRAVGSHASIGLRTRGYSQQGAGFYEARYSTFPMLPRYRTADKKLARNRSAMLGIRADWASGAVGPFEETRLDASFDVYDQWFVDFSPLSRRRAAIVSLGVSAQW